MARWGGGPLLNFYELWDNLERGLGRGADGLAAVDHGQQRALGIEAPLDQVVEQRLAHGPVLGAAIPEPEWMLVTVGVDAERHHDPVLSDLDAIDEECHEIQLAEVPPEELGQLALGAGYEAARDRGMRGRLRLQLSDWLLPAR